MKMATLKQAIKTIYSTCFSLQKKNTVLILYSPLKKDLVSAFSTEAKAITPHVTSLLMKEPDHNGQEPDPSIAKAMLRYDVIIILTGKSLTHTRARKASSLQGAKVASMPNVTKDMLQRCITIDYAAMAKEIRKISQALTDANLVTITNAAGTHLSMSVQGRTAKDDNGLIHKGICANLPAGESFIAPVEGTTHGVYVVEGSQAGIGKLKKPITITVEKGFASAFEGCKEASILQKKLESVNDKNAFNIAELGIGANPQAKITGIVLEDEKVRGTCHIALGSNFAFGGKVKVPIHLDGIILKPTILVDGKKIMEQGKLLV